MKPEPTSATEDDSTPQAPQEEGVEPQFVIQALQEQLQNLTNVHIMLTATLRQREARHEQERTLWFAERQSLLADKGSGSSDSS